MISRSDKTLELVNRLHTIIETRKMLEREESMLKDGLRDLMGDSAALSVGDYVVVRTMRSRKDLDRVALEHDLGSAYVKYCKTSTYEVMEIKKAVIVKEA